MRYLVYILMAAVASVTVLPSSAMAQSDIGTNVDHKKKRLAGFDDLYFQNSVRAGLNVVSLCLAEKRPAQAIKTLSYGFMSGEQASSLDKFLKKFANDSSCNLTGHVESDVPSVPVVGGMAEFFLLGKYTPDDIASLDGMTQSDWDAGFMKPRNANESFGQCVVRTKRAAVFKLANTIPDTHLESKSIEAILPSLGPCVADGQEVSFDKTSLRAILAFSLYRVVSQHQAMRDSSK